MAEGFFLFPGQGAQTVGMAKDAYDAGGHAVALFDEASEILGFDLAAMTFAGDEATLALTENCQPALLVASLALLDALRETRLVTLRGAAGLSLGEYTALVALEAMDFADAVRLVRRRGELMAAAGGGATGMVTVLGLDAETVERVCREAAGGGLLVPANYNCPGQIAVSGDLETLKSSAEAFKAAGAKRVMPLNVAAAFHSPAMAAAREGLEAALRETPIRRPLGRFVNNADAKELSDPEAIRESLARQVASPVLWEQSCRLICGWGERTFFEVGPGKVCAGLMKRICPEAAVRPVGSMADIAALGDG